MGRRSRARQRAATLAQGPAKAGPGTTAAGRGTAAGQGTAAGRGTGAGPGVTPSAAGPGRTRWRRVLAALNPFTFRPPSRTRVRNAAVGFGLAAVVFAVGGWVTAEPAWFNSAVLLAILALAWGLRAAFMREHDRST